MKRYFFVVLWFLLLLPLFVFPGLVFSSEDASVDQADSVQDVVSDTRSKSVLERKKELLERRKKIRDNVEKRREEVKERRDKVRDTIRDKREEFQERLQQIKDERKKKIVERIAGKLDAINERWVNHWNRVLGRLSELLAKIESRADLADEKGKDTSSLREAISVAKSAITDAQASVGAQAEKEYVIVITDGDSLRDDVKAVTSALREDLTHVKGVVKEARTAVREALKLLKDLFD